MADDPSRGGGLVDCRPIAAAVSEVVERGVYTWSEIAQAAGMTNGSTRIYGDTTRLKRRLGLKRGGDGAFQQQMTYELATRIVRAAGIDPVDVDL